MLALKWAYLAWRQADGAKELDSAKFQTDPARRAAKK
jgi:hypothetical protein